MIPRKALIALAAVLMLGGSACGRYTTSYAAVVNSTRITFAQLDRAVAAAASSQKQAPSLDAQRQALIALIQRALIAQQLQRYHIVVSEADVKARVASVRKGFANDQQFTQALAQQGLTVASFEERVRDQAGVEQLQEKVVPVTVTDAEVRAAYQEALPDLTQAHVRHILFSTQSQSPAAALAKARDAVAQLRGGADFATLAKKLSDDPGSKPQGGDLGTQAASQYVAEFAKAVSTLPVKTISDPVKTQFGYHVIEVLSRTVTPYDTARERLRSQVLQTKVRGPFQQYISAVLAQSSIEVNPRIGDLDPSTFKIVDHRFFVPSSPEPGDQQPGGAPLGGGLGGAVPAG